MTDNWRLQTILYFCDPISIYNNINVLRIFMKFLILFYLILKSSRIESVYFKSNSVEFVLLMNVYGLNSQFIITQ